MIFYSSCKFGILKRWTNIPWYRRFDSGFWKTLKQIYRKLEYKRKVFGKFQGLPCFSREMTLPRFPRKMVMNLLRKFVIFKHCTIIQLFRRFDLRVWKNFHFWNKIVTVSVWCITEERSQIYKVNKVYKVSISSPLNVIIES